jgi:hypothetical protein
MTDKPIVAAERYIVSEEEATTSREQLLACIGFVALIAAIDLVTANVNLSTLYALPVLLISQSRRQMASQLFMLSAVALTYLGYFLGPRPMLSDGTALTPLQMLSDWRMFNRSLSAVALCGIAGISSLQIRFHLALERRRAELEASDADARIYEEILQSFKQLAAMIASLVIVAVVVVADLVTPAQYNLPILYGLPLVICAATNRRAMLWSMLPALLIFTYAGYVIGPSAANLGQIQLQMDASEQSVMFRSLVLRNVPALLTNRSLAACVMVGSTVLLHWWMRPIQPSPRPIRPKPIPA